VSVFGDAPANPYTVFAFERKSNTILWTSGVWAGEGFLPRGGIGGYPGPGKVDLVINGNTVTVFGVVSYGALAYIERFDLKTGQNLSRFNTAYYAYDK
jgi:hypothetical protein